jgi:hypothetical protein
MNSPQKITSVFEKPIAKYKTDVIHYYSYFLHKVSLSAFSFLFSEVIQYSYAKAATTSEFQQRYLKLCSKISLFSLFSLGYRVGARAFETCNFKDNAAKREIKVVKMLVCFCFSPTHFSFSPQRFVSVTIWKYLFGKEADHLEKVVDKPECIFIVFDVFLNFQT